MPIKPNGSQIVINGSSLMLDDLAITTEHQLFQRQEFEHNKLRQAKNTDGSTAIFITLLGGRVAQLASTCGAIQSVRPVTPDDSDINNIEQRFNITRYQLTGGPSSAASVNALKTLAALHQVLLARFEAHQAITQLDVSYQELVTLQAETFSYLTTTGISMSGAALDNSTVSNILVTQFNAPVMYEIPTPQTLIKGWSATIEVRTIQAAAAT